MKKMNRILSGLLILALVFTMLPTSAVAVVKQDPASETSSTIVTSPLEDPNYGKVIAENYPSKATGSDNVLSSAISMNKGSVVVQKLDDLDLDLTKKTTSVSDLAVSTYNDDDIVRVIVVLEDESLLESGYTTEQIASGTASVERQIASMKRQQDSVAKKIDSIVSDLNNAKFTAEVKYNYNVAVNGFAIEVPYAAMKEIESLKNVKSVFIAPQYSLPEDVSGQVASPDMYATTTSFGSALTWEALGYTGAGMRIAIIDTGLDIDHPSFAADNFQTTSTSLTLEEVSSVLENLNAYDLYLNLSAEDVYVSAKIPFAFNYVDENLDVTHDNDLQGDHGTHVAGIAAANKLDTTTVVGVAPDAQLIPMKVFGANGGAYFDDILAALEDCFYLNVDAVNLSLGSPAGFSDSGSEETDAIFARILDSDMIASISAGNSASAANGNAIGTNLNFTSDPDNGIVSSPATFTGATMVASLENASYMTNYLVAGDQKVVYWDYYGLMGYSWLSMQILLGEQSYVVVPGVGTEADFAQVDVTGKIALVQRGEIAFTDKQLNAYNSGAIGCLVYDNVDGELITMQQLNTLEGYEDIVFPNAFISLADGTYMVELAGEDGEGELTITDDLTAFPSSTAGQLSDFSSWGVTPDLQLAPDVTAPGGNIYSCYMDGQYGTMSGTSMSAPHIAGMSALVLQYLDDQYDLTDSETHTIAEALIMSTASPVLESTGIPYSPRKQGSGSANVYDAIVSPSYLTVNGDKPKVSMGDDPEKTGVYTFSFEINNLSDVAMAYRLDATTMTDQVLEYYGFYFMSETSHQLDSEVEFFVVANDTVAALDYNEDGSATLSDIKAFLDDVNYEKDLSHKMSFDLVTDGVLDTSDVMALYNLYQSVATSVDQSITVVPANSSTTVTVCVTLSDEDKAYMDTYYENGIYVDGFIRCYAVDGSTDLTLPFMGFYGDWSTAGKVFDTGWYYQDDSELMYERYLNVLWTTFGSRGGYLLGFNPYIDEAYDPAHNVVSPNGDGYQDAVDDLYLGMMRNARELTFTWSCGGVDLAQATAEYVRKSYYYSYYGICYPFVYSEYFDEWYTFIDEETGEPLPDGTIVDFTIKAYTDDGDYIADDVIDNISIVVDNTAPEIVAEEYIYDEETDTRTLIIDVTDNYDIAAVVTMTNAGSPIEYIAVDDKAGEVTQIALDVSGYDSTFWIAVCDYGCNESYYEITFEGEFNTDFDKFYAYRRFAAVTMYSSYYGQYVTYTTDAYNGWHSFEDPSSMLMHTSMYSDNETAVEAAEYIDGYIFGVDVEGNIFVMKAGDWTRIPLGTMPYGYDASWDYVPYPVLDMAYDYANDVLYLLTDELVAGDGGHLMTLDYMTGYVTDLGIVTTSEGSQPLTLACDNEGTLYTIDYVTGDLYTIDPENKEVIEPTYSWEDDIVYIHATYVGATGYIPAYAQTMTYDHAAEKLYWLAFDGVTGAQGSYMLEVNTETGALVSAAPVEYSSEMTAVFKPYDSGVDIIPDAELEAIELSETSLVMSSNSLHELTVYPVPFNADLGDLTWDSSDPGVVVAFDGYVYAIGEGSATVTVTTADGIYAECVVDVVNLSATLTHYDMGNTYYWQTYNAANPGDAAYVEGALESYNGFTAAAYFDGKVYASEYGGNFFCLDPETMTGSQIGTSGSTLFGMAFNYADGYMYGIEYVQIGWWTSYYYLSRVNLNTGALERVASLPETFAPQAYLAIDYEGNFYSIGYDYNTYELVLAKFSVSDGSMVVDATWSLGEAGYSLYNYSSMVYSAEDNGLFYCDSAGALYWIDMDSLTADNYVARVVNVGYIGEPTGYAMNMAMFTVPETEPELPQVTVTDVTVPSSYLVMLGASTSNGVTVEPWNAHPAITCTVADETIATILEDGSIYGVSSGSTTVTISVDGWDTVYEVPVTVVESTGTLGGFLITDFMYGGDFFITFSDTDPVNDIAGVSDYTDFTIFSGAYFDGGIYAYGQDATGDLNYKNYFLTVNIETYEINVGAQVHYTLRDMAMDYTTNNLYAIAEGAEYKGAVAQVNRETGEVTIIADTGIAIAAMTISADGQMYVIGEDDNLYTVDKTTGELTLVGNTGVNAGRTFQSMHYDLDTGNIYWAQVADDQSSSLRIVDATTGASTSLGTISGSGAQVSALYTIPGNEPVVPDEDTFKVTGIKLPESATVVKGNTLQLNATVLTSVELKPSADAMSTNSTSNVVVNWTSSDESVASVDATGLVTGVSAGEATITASTAGFTATCKVLVTDSERLMYAYDESNTQWVSFSSADPATVTVERDDAEGEAKLVASTYTGEVIYAYDVDGYFYSIDADTFERTALGTGINGLVYEAEIYSYSVWDYVTVECELDVVDLSYDNGILYAAVSLMYDNEHVSSLICSVDVTSGLIETIYQSDEIAPANLLVSNGIGYFVDDFMTGMLTYVDMTATEFTYSQAALVQGYWGDAAGSVGLYKDPITGTVYAFRDFTDTAEGEWVKDENGKWNWVLTWDGVTGAATLCTLNLSDADIVELGYVGSGTLLMNGLFIK